MTEHVTFDVKFKLDPVKYSITINCGDNGTCSKDPDQPSYVPGYEVKVGAVADPGYVIDTFSLNPAAAGQSFYHMAIDMTNDWTLNVSFKPAPTYLVAFSVCDSTQGTCIVDKEATTYTHGSKIDVEVTPKPGFEIDTVTINDVPQTITNHQLWAKSTIFVTKDLDLKATFRPEPVATPIATIYRFWSDKLQAHFYTISKEVKEHIQRTYPTNVWNYEGIAYYGVR